MKLKEYISIVPTKEDLHREILLVDAVAERRLLDDFCKIKARRGRVEEAWSYILHAIADKNYPSDMTPSLSDETLNYLIDKKINLCGLGHMQLPDIWLQKIFERDNNCIEALQTIEARKNA